MTPRLPSDCALCTRETCPAKETCLRWTSEPHDRQWYMLVPDDGPDCGYFIPNEKAENNAPTKEKSQD